MSLITLSELKAVLGIGDIYSDEIVQAVADSAENIILSYLIFDKVSIHSVKIVNNVATFYTENNTFVTGQALTVSNCGSPFDGARTVVDYSPTHFTVALTNADIITRQLLPRGSAVLTSQAALYDATPEVREAALAVACDIWITRTGTLGQSGVDFQSPAPYRLGRSMITRVSGLLGKHLDTRGYLG
ncbi:hypothetical protein UFOVP482_23 [uncultured Caudovirales phage]|uniref:Gp6 domain containing protein n=1 Tax=uncultured Caudovirales phage TaxID=2100421 RepID=A0A6J5MF90_9CAUD|nr:hypothetical protein UFOVP482_23 [uncultured Caudovirales phage]